MFLGKRGLRVPFSSFTACTHIAQAKTRAETGFLCELLRSDFWKPLPAIRDLYVLYLS